MAFPNSFMGKTGNVQGKLGPASGAKTARPVKRVVSVQPSKLTPVPAKGAAGPEASQGSFNPAALGKRPDPFAKKKKKLAPPVSGAGPEAMQGAAGQAAAL